MSILRPTVSEVFLTDRNELEQIKYENAFFFNIRLEHNVKKTTYPNRLNDLNEIVMHHLPANRPLELMDVAISSGISTVEWSNSLHSCNIDHNIVASDLVIDTSLISMTRIFNILVTSRNNPIQFDIMGLSITYASNRLVVSVIRFLLKKVYETILRIDPNLRDGTIEQYDGRYGIKKQPVKLVSRLVSMMQDIQLMEDDIITNYNLSMLNRFDVVRAANILNPRCFDHKILVEILKNLGKRLKVGGLLIECRTDENSVNNGTIFRINQKMRFEIVERIGKGSEIEQLFLMTSIGKNDK